MIVIWQILTSPERDFRQRTSELMHNDTFDSNNVTTRPSHCLASYKSVSDTLEPLRKIQDGTRHPKIILQNLG